MSKLSPSRKVPKFQTSYRVSFEDQKILKHIKYETDRSFKDITLVFMSLLLSSKHEPEFPLLRNFDSHTAYRKNLDMTSQDREALRTMAKIKKTHIRVLITSWIHYALHNINIPKLMEVLKTCQDIRVNFKNL